MKLRKYESKIVQRILDDMAKQPWHVRFRRWLRLHIWVYKCLIFNRKWR